MFLTLPTLSVPGGIDNRVERVGKVRGDPFRLQQLLMEAANFDATTFVALRGFSRLRALHHPNSQPRGALHHPVQYACLIWRLTFFFFFSIYSLNASIQNLQSIHLGGTDLGAFIRLFI